jgi:hypothetical protein
MGCTQDCRIEGVFGALSLGCLVFTAWIGAGITDQEVVDLIS